MDVKNDECPFVYNEGTTPQSLHGTVSYLVNELEKSQLRQLEDQALIEKLRCQVQQLRSVLADYNRVLQKCIGQLKNVGQNEENGSNMA
ncbi:hypothetical protein BBP40_007912 [Aspergillus hancockii]|nr:hypothetical protein BBP40_007912 [Aspergillus hancockii]